MARYSDNELRNREFRKAAPEFVGRAVNFAAQFLERPLLWGSEPRRSVQHLDLHHLAAAPAGALSVT